MTTHAHGPVTIEEIADRLIPADARISPNGRHVAFTVATTGRKTKRYDRAIWLSTDGEPARRFTGGTDDNHDPRWSPNSGVLAFLAQRETDDDHRIYVIPTTGGEAQQLGSLSGKLSRLSWSPDGTHIAVLRTDPKEKDDAPEGEKNDATVYEEDDKVDRLWLVDASTGDARCLTYGKYHVWDYGWSPDEAHLVIVTSDLPVANDIFRSSAMHAIPVSGGLSRHLADFRNLPSDPVVRTVDGEQVIAFVGNDHRADPSPAVWMIPLAGGQKRKLIENHQSASVGIVADPATDDGLIVNQAEGTHVRQYRFSCDTGELTALPASGLDGGSVTGAPSMAAETGDRTVIWSTIDQPEEVYRITPDGDVTRLTSFGKSFAGRLAGGDIVRWESSDGVEVEGILFQPLGYEEGKRYPLFVQVHGGPASHWRDRVNMTWHDWAQMMAANGFAVLLPNPRGSIAYGTPFEQLLQDDVGGGESRDLVSGAQAMVERGIADPNRLTIGGWSWGGYLTAWTITQTDIFRAAVMGAGVANNVSDHGAGDIADYNTLIYPDHPYVEEAWEYYARISPVRYARNVTTPTLIVHGESDARVHISQGQEYYRALKTCGAPVQFVRYPREGHGFQEYRHQIDLMERIKTWLIEHVS
ncbi:MAG TPA: S9 family peptidase [Thermomicrobiales bacterium]|nr:S9 family peptidase [Thermomicrobiales bacterium]